MDRQQTDQQTAGPGRAQVRQTNWARQLKREKAYGRIVPKSKCQIRCYIVCSCMLEILVKSVQMVNSRTQFDTDRQTWRVELVTQVDDLHR